MQATLSFKRTFTENSLIESASTKDKLNVLPTVSAESSHTASAELLTTHGALHFGVAHKHRQGSKGNSASVQLRGLSLSASCRLA